MPGQLQGDRHRRLLRQGAVVLRHGFGRSGSTRHVTGNPLAWHDGQSLVRPMESTEAGGGGMSYPVHPYFDPSQFHVGEQAQAAEWARDAANTLGQEYVNQQLIDAERFGANERAAAEVAQRAAHEAYFYRDLQVRNQMAASAAAMSQAARQQAEVAEGTDINSVVSPSADPKTLSASEPPIRENPGQVSSFVRPATATPYVRASRSARWSLGTIVMVLIVTFVCAATGFEFLNEHFGKPISTPSVNAPVKKRTSFPSGFPNGPAKAIAIQIPCRYENDTHSTRPPAEKLPDADINGVVFENFSGKNLDLYWRDQYGNRIFYQSIPHNYNLYQQTSANHIWLLVDEHTGACKGLFRMGKADAAITVRKRKTTISRS